MEQTRLDKILKNGFVVPNAQNEDTVDYVRDVKPFLSGSDFYLSKIKTDWTTNSISNFKESDQEKLEKGAFFRYIRADQSKVYFTSRDGKQTKPYYLTDIFRKSFSLTSESTLKENLDHETQWFRQRNNFEEVERECSVATSSPCF